MIIIIFNDVTKNWPHPLRRGRPPPYPPRQPRSGQVPVAMQARGSVLLVMAGVALVVVMD